MSGNWVAKKTIDGMDYYYNTSSKALTWDKPEALKTAEEKRVDDQNLAWVPNQQHCYVEGLCAFDPFFLLYSNLLCFGVGIFINLVR